MASTPARTEGKVGGIKPLTQEKDFLLQCILQDKALLGISHALSIQAPSYEYLLEIQSCNFTLQVK